MSVKSPYINVIEAKTITVIDTNDNCIKYENVHFHKDNDELTILQENICVVYNMKNVVNYFYDIPPMNKK